MSDHQEKRTIWSWNYLTNYDDETYRFYALTDRQAQALETAINPILWYETRWINPSQPDTSEFVGGLIERILTPMDICALLIDCINNDTDTQTALDEYLQDRGNPSAKSTENIGTGDGNIIAGLPCDFDSIYGYAVAIEDYINLVIIDLLESIENETNQLTVALRIIDFTPIIGDLPFLDDLNDLVDWVKGEGLSSYNTGYTTTMRQDLICGLFNLMCTDCYVSPSEISSYYGGLGGISILKNDVWVAIMRLFLNLTGNTAFVYGMHAFIASILSTGARVQGLSGLHGLQTIAASGNPDNDWLVFCDPCAGWVYDVTFSVETGEWSVYNSQSQWVSGIGFQSVAIGGNALNRIRLIFDNTTTLDSVGFWGNAEYPDTTGIGNRGVQINNFAAVYGALPSSSGSQAQFTIINMQTNTSSVEINWNITGHETATVISRIRLTGTGTPPF